MKEIIVFYRQHNDKLGFGYLRSSFPHEAAVDTGFIFILMIILFIGVIMLVGWLQGKHILDMFTIGVR